MCLKQGIFSCNVLLNLLLYHCVCSPKAPLYDMEGHEDKILAVDWSMPQYMLSGGADNHLKIFKHGDKELYGRPS